MGNAGRMTTHLHASRREGDWRRADESRRLQARPEVAPMAIIETTPRPRLATILRRIPNLIPRHA